MDVPPDTGEPCEAILEAGQVMVSNFGTTRWQVPPPATFISVLAIGSGARGGLLRRNVNGGAGGGGGALAVRNAWPVAPGGWLTISISQARSMVTSDDDDGAVVASAQGANGAAGGLFEVGDFGFDGGTGAPASSLGLGGAGGGAGGYNHAGGDAGTTTPPPPMCYIAGGGGGVGIRTVLQDGQFGFGDPTGAYPRGGIACAGGAGGSGGADGLTGKAGAFGGGGCGASVNSANTLGGPPCVVVCYFSHAFLDTL